MLQNFHLFIIIYNDNDNDNDNGNGNGNGNGNDKHKYMMYLLIGSQLGYTFISQVKWKSHLL